ncbi:MAG TPA: hypothetical protein VF178_06635 [Gemmatimonadaceae bacterium]
MSAEQPRPGEARGALNIIVVGNDTLIEALPALPVQVAHACLAAGFDHVFPLSWGDELVAAAALQALEQRPGEPAVFCACPFVRQRLLGAGAELAPLVINLPSPAVALARYLRAAYGSRLGSLTFVGRCPSARRGEYDAAHEPRELLAQFYARGIDVNAQPEVFEGVLPPDRRRFASLPGGCPTAEMLWSRSRERLLVELDERDLPIELAEILLERRPVLVDLAPGLGCACSGVAPATPGRSARIAVMSLEPPRASGPVIELSPSVLEVVLGNGEDEGSDGPDEPADPGSPPDTGGQQASELPAREVRSGDGDNGEDAGVPRSSRSSSERRPRPPRAPLAITPPRALEAIPPSRSPKPVGAGSTPRGVQEASYSSRARVMAAVSHSSGD